MAAALITNLIQKELEKINQIKPEDFIFDDFPESTLTVFNPEPCDNPQIENECETLSENESDESILLNSTQLNCIRKNGTFNVKSKFFEKNPYTWRVSRLLQSGTFNLADSFINGIANCVDYILKLSHKFYKSKISIYEGVKNICTAVFQLPECLIGGTNCNPTLDQKDIIKLKDFLKENVSVLTKSNNDTSTKIYSGDEYLAILRRVRNCHDHWFVNEDKKLKYLRKTGDLTTKAIADIFNEDFINFLENNISVPDSQKLTTLAQNVLNFREIHKKYNQALTSAVESYKKNLQINHWFMGRVHYFVDNAVANYIDTYTKVDPKNNLENLVSKSLKGQEKIIYDFYSGVKKSKEFLDLKNYLEKDHAVKRFIFRYNVHDYTQWEVEKLQSGAYYLVNYKTFSYCTSKPGWKILNIGYVFAQYFAEYYGLFYNNLTSSNFCAKSLYSTEPFVTDYFFRSSTGTFSVQMTDPLILKLHNLWLDVFDKRRDFELQKDKGILGKNISRIFDLVLNYFFKGALSSIILCLAQVFFVLVFNFLNIGCLILLPITCAVISVFYYMTCVFVKDLTKTSTHENPNPTIASVFSKVFVGLLIVVFSILSICFYIAATGLTCSWSILTNGLKYLYDTFVFYLVLKPFARVPAIDNYFSKRVSGPLLCKEYYTVLETSSALTLLLDHLNFLKADYWKQSMLNKIKKPSTDIKAFYKEIGLNIQSDILQNAKKYETVLYTKLNEIYNSKVQKVKSLDDKTKTFAFTQKGLKIALEKGSDLCKNIFTTEIFSKMTQSDIESFWKTKYITVDDWNALTMKFYKEIFGEKIGTPIEDLDNGFYLQVKTTGTKYYVTDSIKGNPKTTCTYIPRHAHSENKNNSFYPLVTYTNLIRTWKPDFPTQFTYENLIETSETELYV